MRLYSESKNYKLYQGSMLDMLEVIEPGSIDCVVTDPPYELNFMGKGWDNAGVSFNVDTWRKCYEVLKPGGYLLAFGGSRTYHRIACAIEDAGFEIRDTIIWLYGSGFPKSTNIGLAIDKKNGVESIDTGIASPNARPNSTKDNTLFESGTVGKIFNIKVATNEWQGWGTCLKPSFEPIILARKPFKGSLVDNVIENGVGGLNIDECRVELNRDKKITGGCKTREDNSVGRFPANTILTYDETDFDEVCGGFPISKSQKPRNISKEYTSKIYGKYAQRQENCIYDDSGSASRYFYCAKASKKDRDEGLEIKNIHPTVKPTELMQYLVRLVAPQGATILDPFNGSGSTGKAVMYENKERDKDYKYIGIELTEEYLPIAKARIEYVILDEEKINEDYIKEQLDDFLDLD